MFEYKEKVKEIIEQAEKEVESLLGRKIKLEMVPIGQILMNEPERIKEIIVETSGIPWDKIKSRCKETEVCQARHFYCYFIKKLTNKSLKSIGLELCGRDHTTVGNSIKVIGDMFDIRDRSYLDLHEKIVDRLNSGAIASVDCLN